MPVVGTCSMRMEKGVGKEKEGFMLRNTTVQSGTCISKMEEYHLSVLCCKHDLVQ